MGLIIIIYRILSILEEISNLFSDLFRYNFCFSDRSWGRVAEGGGARGAGLDG